MARLGLYLLCVTVLFNVYVQADGDASAEPKTVPLVNVSHVQLCKLAVSQISEDIRYSKRNERFVNIVVNVCFPGVHPDTLLKLISMLSKLRPPVIPSSSVAPEDSSSGNTFSWDNELLPEIGPGQEGLEDAGVIGGEDELPNVIDNLLTETGAGQEGVQNGGQAAEGTDRPDGANNGDWWGGKQPTAGTGSEEQQAYILREENERNLIDSFKAWLSDKIASLKAENNNDDLFSTTESSEQKVTDYMATTTKEPIVTTEPAIPTTAKASTTEEPIATTETDWSDALNLLFGDKIKRSEELIALLLSRDNVKDDISENSR